MPCSGGTFSYTGASSCSCDSPGYTWNGSACISATCSFSGITGIADGTTVNYTTSSVTRACDSPFTGSITYICLGGGAAPSSITGSCSAPGCTGGTITTVTVGGTTYKVHTFTAGGTLDCPVTKTADILVVGAGGGYYAGGGGGGGVVLKRSHSVTATTHSVSVGNGKSMVWAGSPSKALSGKGEDSSFDSTIIAKGGGGRSQYEQTGGLTNSAGGSGGGSHHGITDSGGTANTGSGGTSYYANVGGNISGTGNCEGGAGGGGAGAVGGDSTGCNVHGNGGRGISFRYNGSSFDISATTTNAGGNDEFTGSTTLTFYGGGGGGGGSNGTQVSGGLGGGGNSVSGGTNGLGGGAGGKADKGGSGVVIVRYPN